MVERISGKTPQALINPAEKPDFLINLWHDFLALNSTRQAGMAMQSISYFEIDAYSRLMKISFSRAEIIAIKRLDVLLMNQSNKGEKWQLMLIPLG